MSEAASEVAAVNGEKAAGQNGNAQLEAQAWLADARFKELLGADPSHKSLFVLLEKKNGEQGVLAANKSPFAESAEDVNKLIESTQLTEVARNDVFGNYTATVAPELNCLNAQLIFPANEKIIAKYRREEKFVIRETPEDYATLTLEWINKHQHDLNWVYNFLDGRAEADRVIFHDPDPQNGFMLAPDLKWNGKVLENLYVLAIVKRHGIKSIRDLTAADLPLLEGIRDKGADAIREKYGVRTDQLRAYFHYQPTFYHLHVHFVALSYDAPASQVLSAVALDDVINNIKLMPDFYQKATLTFARKKSDRLLEMFRQAGRAPE